MAEVKKIVPTLKAVIPLFLILAALPLIYWHGLYGLFYFDDYGSLFKLASGGGVTNLNAFISFVFGGDAGPSGRPISLLSFLIDDNSWPSNPFPFKYTNLCIHLLNTCGVFWLMWLITKIQVEDKRLPEKAAWIVTFFATAVWSFNPINVSTVLYVVQRMAQLSALFVIYGLIFYVKIRITRFSGSLKDHCKLGAGLVTFSILAVFSKENGALLPVLCLVVEACILANKSVYPRLSPYFKLVFFYFPFVIIVAFIFFKSMANGWFDIYPVRDFSPWQRLITEPCLLLKYISGIIAPSLYTSGIYFDNIKAFSGLSLIAVSGILLVVSLNIWAVHYRNKYPLVALAILFYFSGQIIESTSLSLELYFEHRNYLPSIFVGLVFVPIIIKCLELRFYLGLVLVFSLPVIYGSITYARADLWGDPLEFGLYIAEKNPHSVRAQVEKSNALTAVGLDDEAMKGVKSALKDSPGSLALNMKMLLIDCADGKASAESRNGLLNVARTHAYDARLFLTMQNIWGFMERGTCDGVTPLYMKQVLDAFQEGQEVGRDEGEKSRTGLKLFQYRWSIKFSKNETFRKRIVKSLMDRKDPEFIMVTAAYFASNGYFVDALELAGRAKELVGKGILAQSDKTQSDFSFQIDHFIDTVKNDMKEGAKDEAIRNNTGKK